MADQGFTQTLLGDLELIRLLTPKPTTKMTPITATRLVRTDNPKPNLAMVV
jgi:hypothetical protein